MTTSPITVHSDPPRMIWLVSKRFRSGMTLPELLVVVAIIGLLAVTVLPAFSTTNEARRSRTASNALSSFVAKAQARSVGRSTWAGFQVIPINASSAVADQLAVVDCPEPYRGDTSSAAVTVAFAGTSGTATPTSAADFATFSTFTITAADVIRFDGKNPGYQLTSGTAIPFCFSLRDTLATEDVGQSSAVTAWPSSTGSHTVEIFRQPIPAGTPFVLPEGRVIDLSHSGYGMAFQTFATSPSYVTGIVVLFDASGRPRQFRISTSNGVANTTAVLTANAPLFFLVGRPDRAGNAQTSLDPNDDSVGANWQYPESWWIGLDPASGVVKASQCPANAISVTDSQKLIRAEMTGTAIASPNDEGG